MTEQQDPPTEEEARTRAFAELLKVVPAGVWVPLLIIGGPALGVTLANYLGLATRDEITEIRAELADLRDDLEEDRAQRERILELVRDLTNRPESP